MLVRQHGGKTFLVVGHGLVNRVLLAHWLGLPLRLARRLPQDNAGLNLIEFHGLDAKVRTVNAVGHLAGVAPDLIPSRATGEDPWRERVLVTGGLGYLGSILCEHLLAAGYP